MSLHSVYVRISLLAIFFITLHYTDDVIRKVRGMDQGGIGVLFAVLMLMVWLFAILVLTERKSGYLISLIVSLLNSLIPLGHLTGMAGEATPGEILTSSGPFFVWVDHRAHVDCIPLADPLRVFTLQTVHGEICIPSK
jgi:hypothetical protein